MYLLASILLRVYVYMWRTPAQEILEEMVHVEGAVAI